MRLTVLFWLFYEMSESETYKELGALTKCKERWEECIPYVSSLLTSDSVKIQAKALWMLGEMGLFRINSGVLAGSLPLRPR